tara:strand:+ start:328 stop:594 length:267 start_codon:yes stop_codon:yes gene_type:complete
MVADIELSDIEQLQFKLELLDEYKIFRTDQIGKLAGCQILDQLNEIKELVDQFFDEIDSNDYNQPDPNEVLQAVLEMRTEEFKKELQD